MENKEIDFDGIHFKSGLIPAIVQDYRSKAVLMLAYMNEAALQLSLETGQSHFWSRSRQCLWRKGETSGHIQKIKKIAMDCDQDTLLLEVEQVGVACHTGRPSCFFRELTAAGSVRDRGENCVDGFQGSHSVLEALSRVIGDKKKHPSPASYTSLLLAGGIDGILKKVGEESAELILGAKNGNREEIVHEVADLLYHVLVVLGYYEIPFTAIEKELEQRRRQSGLEEKRSRTPPPSHARGPNEKEEEA